MQTISEQLGNIFQLLSVEDNEADAGILKLFFAESTSPIQFRNLPDVTTALDYLHRRKGYESATRPDLILLDLNLPRNDGRDLLREVKAKVELKSIPVIVLSTSNSEKDVYECYELGAAAFISKPLDLAGFEAIVRSIESFWVAIARLPTHKGTTKGTAFLS